MRFVLLLALGHSLSEHLRAFCWPSSSVPAAPAAALVGFYREQCLLVWTPVSKVEFLMV